MLVLSESFGEHILTLTSSDPSQVGTYLVTVEVSLSNFAEVAPASKVITIDVICEVTALNWSASTDVPASYAHLLTVDPVPVTLTYGAD